jgi:hypothetical protein
MEALVCSNDHPSVIKCYAIHAKTIEVYQMWWNGNTLREMLILIRINVSPKSIPCQSGAFARGRVEFGISTSFRDI